MGLYRSGTLSPVPRGAESAIFAGVGRVLRDARLPHTMFREVGCVGFYEDQGMTMQNGVLGAVCWWSPREIRLAPVVVQNLSAWIPSDDMAEIALSIGIVIHELTHLRQLAWLGGFAWPFLNAPIINHLTIERWAEENELVARTSLY